MSKVITRLERLEIELEAADLQLVTQRNKIAEQARQITDLQEANNRYLERARNAEAQVRSQDDLVDRVASKVSGSVEAMLRNRGVGEEW